MKAVINSTRNTDLSSNKIALGRATNRKLFAQLRYAISSWIHSPINMEDLTHP